MIGKQLRSAQAAALGNRYRFLLIKPLSAIAKFRISHQPSAITDSRFPIPDSRSPPGRG
ncbi:MAG: hypothetical protein F6K57_03760 [Moorea sp. SIO4A5]|nr:hypothetical protein [Moorena sp. SIO4A5]NEO18526.1 hypothetical protein [Moorena sp. SIO4A5]